MKAMAWILNNRRLVLATAILLSATGAVLWMTMVRQEDPRLPDFWGQVVAPYPGADALTVERLVLEPIEDALAEVDQIKSVEATAYEEVAVLRIELLGDVRDFNHAWDEVRDALEKARLDFPDGAGRPVLDEKQVDQDAVVLAVTGNADSQVLLAGARRVKDLMQRLALVKRGHLIADPGEQVTRRIRPILLTTATTVAGLVPLALSSSTLWPPLASAMISGLLSSTMLTLVVVPALYRVLMQPLKLRKPAWLSRRPVGRPTRRSTIHQS